MGIRAIQDHVIVTDMNFDERVSTGGIVLIGDDQKSSGIRPRWGRVVAVGSRQLDIKVNQYVLVKHGRWTRGIEIDGEVIRRVDIDDILVVSDVLHDDESDASTEVVVDQQPKNIDDVYNY